MTGEGIHSCRGSPNLISSLAKIASQQCQSPSHLICLQASYAAGLNRQRELVLPFPLCLLKIGRSPSAGISADDWAARCDWRPSTWTQSAGASRRRKEQGGARCRGCPQNNAFPSALWPLAYLFLLTFSLRSRRSPYLRVLRCCTSLYSSVQHLNREEIRPIFSV